MSRWAFNFFSRVHGILCYLLAVVLTLFFTHTGKAAANGRTAETYLATILGDGTFLVLIFRLKRINRIYTDLGRCRQICPPPSPLPPPPPSRHKPALHLVTLFFLVGFVRSISIQDEEMKGADKSSSGQGAATVYRDKKGRKLDMLNEFMRQQDARAGKEVRCTTPFLNGNVSVCHLASFDAPPP